MTGASALRRADALRTRGATVVPAWVSVLGALAFYLGFAMLFTWPLVLEPGVRIFGGAGDLTGGIAFYRELVEGGHNPFAPGTISDFNAPAGLEIRWPLNVATAPSTALIYAMATAFGPIAALGLYALLGMTLSGLAMFLLARRLTGNGWVALIAGWAFAFYPFALINAQGHADFAHGWPLVLLIWRMLELSERPTARNGLWAGIAAVLAFLWTPYFLIIGGVVFGVLLAYALVRGARSGAFGRTALAGAIACLIALAAIGAVLVAAGSTDASGVRIHTLDELFAFSARPLEYVLPFSRHLLFGGLTDGYLQNHLHGSNGAESTLYVGLTVIALCAVALVALVRRRLPPGVAPTAIALGLMVAAALLMSAPPKTTALGQVVEMPSNWVFELSSTWRVYSRFVIAVMLGLCLLAAIGLAQLVRDRRPAVRAAVLIGVGLAVGIDLWAMPEGRTNVIAAPPGFERLGRLPRGLVADYPLVAVEKGIYNDLFEQGFHDHPVINGYPAGSVHETRALQIADLSDPDTAARLKLLGVRYVIARNPLPGAPGAGRVGAGFESLFETGYARFLRVRGSGSATLATPGRGFWGYQDVPGEEGSWMGERPESEIEVRALCSPCTGVLRFRANSFVVGRRLEARSAQDRLLWRGTVRAGGITAIEIPLRGFDKRTVVRLTTSPGPVRASDALGGEDTRTVSVFIREPEFAETSR